MHTGLSCIEHATGNRSLSVAVGKWLVGYTELIGGACSREGKGNEIDSELEYVRVCTEKREIWECY